MAFGQAAGPPATAKQVQELLALLQAAGHTDFRDARGPMGFTQRQAGGRFTRDEAAALIDALKDAETDESPPDDLSERASETAPRPAGWASVSTLRRLSDEELAAELIRRGWTVIPPL